MLCCDRVRGFKARTKRKLKVSERVGQGEPGIGKLGGKKHRDKTENWRSLTDRGRLRDDQKCTTKEPDDTMSDGRSLGDLCVVFVIVAGTEERDAQSR